MIRLDIDCKVRGSIIVNDSETFYCIGKIDSVFESINRELERRELFESEKVVTVIIE